MSLFKTIVLVLVILAVLAALDGVNALVGTTGSAPLGDAIGPAKLWWWVVLPALALAGYSVWRFAVSAEEKLPGYAGPVLLAGLPYGLFAALWLWTHDANAYLYPTLGGTLAMLASLLVRADWSAAPQPQLASAEGLREMMSDPKLAWFPAQAPRYSFRDVDGMGEVKERLLALGKEALVSKDEEARRRGSDPSVRLRNGALLSGPPGNGKTFFAEALAGELKVRFLPVSIKDAESKWVGEKTGLVGRWFASAVQQAPCVLFIDEIDALLPDRGAVVNADSEVQRTVNALLSHLNDVRGTGVVVMGATNHLGKLDAAAVREGRFDLKLEIPPPDYEARLGILRRGIPAETALANGAKVRLADGVLEMAARHFKGFSVSRLQAIAAGVRDEIKAGGPRRNEVRFAHLLAALRKTQGGANAALREGVPALEELVLQPEAQETLEEFAALMRDIEATELAGAKIQPGIVFHGPPGTGKTLAAKALAKATGWSFIATTGHGLLGSNDAMDKILARASDLRPAIVFIDEADDILGERNYSGMKLATNKLLSLLDGAEERPPDVLFVAATNNARTFDAASLRRFPIKVEFALPGPAEIGAYLRRWRDGLAVPAEAGFDLEQAARLLAGKSISEIRDTLQQAVNTAALRRMTGPSRGLRQEDLARALRSVSVGGSLPT